MNQNPRSNSGNGFRTTPCPLEIHDRFDELLDRFDHLRQQGKPIAIGDFLDDQLGSEEQLKLNQQHHQTLVMQLIEIDLCYLFNVSTSNETSEEEAGLRYTCFGQWAVDYARTLRTKLLNSLHCRTADRTHQSRSLDDDFISRPTFADGRFDIHERLGTGGMGTVFRVQEKTTSNEYALKTLNNRCPSLLYRLKREFRSLVAFEPHPNVILPYELFVDAADAAFTMELVDGTDFVSAFEQIGAANTPADLKQVSLLDQLAKGLHHVHQHRWIHRDLKPSNVLVKSCNRVVLLDFGLIDNWALKNYQQDVASNQGLIGTLHYLSPEQATGQSLTPASDWFSFGVLLYRCLIGELPHTGDTIDEIIQQKGSKLRRDQRGVSELSNGKLLLYQLAVECLRPKPENRPSFEKIESVLYSVCQAITGNQSTDIAKAQGDTQWISKTQNRLFVGRAAEIQLFEQVITDRADPNLIEVVGESGIGKTGFLNHVLNTLISDWTIRSRCFYQEKTRFPGLDSIVDQIADQIYGWPANEVEGILPKDSSPLLSLFPTLAQIGTPQIRGSFFDLTSESSKLYREKASSDFVALIERLAARRPLCLVIDDFQWAKQSSANLISDLINGCKQSTPLTVVLAYRPPKSEADAPNLIDVPQSKRQLIKLPKLSTDDVSDFLAAIDTKTLKRAPNWITNKSTLVEQLADQASGNPLHLWEFIYQLNRSETFPSVADLDYKNLLRKRLANLEPDQFSLIKLISASEFPVDINLANQFVAADSATASIENSLRRLEQEKLLTRSSNPNELEIHHGQISQCVQKMVGSDAMADLHRSIAKLAQQQSPENYRLISEQFQACGLRRDAARALVSAAESAKLRQSYEEAIYLLQQAIVIATDDQTCSQLLVDTKIKMAETLANAGRCKQASELFLELADCQPSLPQTTELRRNAIFQHIFSDQTDIELKTTNQIAQPIGVKISGNPIVAMLNVVFYRMAYSFVTWRGTDNSRRQQQRELVGVVARALTLTNPLLASSLAAKLVFLCKRFGTTEEIEDALDLESFFFKAVDPGKPFNFFGEKIIHAHLEKRLQSDESRHRASALLSNAVVAYTNENLTESLRFNDEAIEVYAQSVDQSDWELEILAAFRIWAYHYTGNFNAFEKMLNSRAGLLSVKETQVKQRKEQAVPRRVLQRLPGYFETYVAHALLQDNVEDASKAVAQVETLISGKGYSGRQHELAFARHYYLMYLGEAEKALANVIYQKKMIWKIGYHLVPVIEPQLLAYEIVTRTAIACQNPATLRSHRRILTKISKKMSRRSSGVRRGLVATINAFEASCEAKTDRFEASVEDAISGFEESGFFSLSFLLRFAAGKQGRTEKQRNWKQQAIRWADERDIKKLEQIHRIAAPAFMPLPSETQL